MGELSQEQVEHQSEVKALKIQMIQIQRAFLMQQRELNMLQMEKLDATEAQLKGESQ